MLSAARLSLFAAAAFALAACSEEKQETTQAEPPAAQEQPAPAGDRVDEGLQKLREGADSLLEGGRQLSEEAIDRANRAIEDAEPTLRRAGEVVNELVERAARDLETAVTELERLIEEADGADEEVVSEPGAVLAPEDQLNADTRAAARAVPAGVGADYVGVWAGEASACRRIDQEAVEMFAVITPTTIRRYESVCNFDSVPLADGTATVSASCIAEGDTEEREITLSMPSPGILRIGTPERPDMAELVRCHLPAQQ